MHRIQSALFAAMLLVASACDHGITEPIVPDAIVLPAVAATLATGDSIALTASYVVGGATQPSDDGLRWSMRQSVSRLRCGILAAPCSSRMSFDPS